jgi:DNA modification methylase
MSVRVLEGDCRSIIATLPSASVHCVVTSPPYFGLRDYGVDRQIGLEPTPDAYAAELVSVFRECRRVLRDDGTLWLNLGDSYAAQRGGTNMPAETLAGGIGGKGDEGSHRGRGGPFDFEKNRHAQKQAHRDARSIGLKHKDLIGIPWLVAVALRADGWYLRSDIIWSKPNPMPESVLDRPTRAHEYIFLLSKSERYFYDAAAIRNPASDALLKQVAEGYAGEDTKDFSASGAQSASGTKTRIIENARRKIDKQRGHERRHAGFSERWDGLSKDEQVAIGSNKRSVWEVATAPFSEAHFATFPPALIEPCIKAGCPEGGTVLDPFGGAGTTGLVADRLQRNAVLIELNSAYAAMARKRINGDAPLFAEAI